MNDHPKPNQGLRLLLVRHGETDWNTTRQYQGQADVPLNALGRQQAVALASRLASESIDIIYASDLSRAWETAQIIAMPHKLPVHSDPRLRELSFGEWQGLTYFEMVEQAPDWVAAWNADRLHRAAPGGETLTQLATRVQGVLDDVLRKHPGQTVLLVAHGGSLKMLLCLLLQKSPREFWQFQMGNTALSIVQYRELGPVIYALNDTHHLS
ncbi:MAG: alpha-ribazole phosphatase [Anaerolineae bacterium]|nr:alpha-ribazole phosphatase [Anaerolineae bacterium]